jgi:DNA-binding response OmpR family regulator
METNRREEIQRSLRYLAETHATTMHFLEQTERTLTLLCEELSLDPFILFQKSPLSPGTTGDQQRLVIDPTLLSVTFRSKTCFLGNTLPFKFLSRLARRPNAYVTCEDLQSEVWQCCVSDAAVRTVAKNLRKMLRNSGLDELAEAVNGSTYGHYVLKLAQ